MSLECESKTGQMNRGSTAAPISLNSGDEVQQVSILFSGSTTDVRDSYFQLDFASGGTCDFPTPRQLKRLHGGTTESSQMNLAYYSKTSNMYGYYVEILSELSDDADVRLRNGDAHNPTKYECVALYHS